MQATTSVLSFIAIVDDIEKDWYGNAEATEGGFIEKAESAAYLALLVAKERYDSDNL